MLEGSEGGEVLLLEGSEEREVEGSEGKEEEEASSVFRLRKRSLRF